MNREQDHGASFFLIKVMMGLPVSVDITCSRFILCQTKDNQSQTETGSLLVCLVHICNLL